MRRNLMTSRAAKLFLLGGAVIAAGVLASQQYAAAADANAQAIKDGLSSFATDTIAKLGLPATDTADHLDYLAQQIPLSDLNPLSASGLDLTDVNNPLAKAIAAASDLSSPAALADSLDQTNTDFGPAHITLGCGDNAHACGHAVTLTGSGPYTLTVPISISASPTVPLHLATDLQDLQTPDDSTHDLTVSLSMSGTLSFGYDASRPDGHRFFLNSSAGAPAQLAFSASIAGPSTDKSFSTDLGLTKLSVTPHVNAATVGFTVTLNAPHAAGDSDQDRITSYDWQNTQLQDLITVTRTGSYDLSLALDSDLIPGSPDATITVTGDTSDGFLPHFSVNGHPPTTLANALSGLSLSDFLNVTPTQILSGLGQLAASIQAIQTAADVHLPFLQNGLTTPTGDSALKLVDSLINALAQQTVVCGPTQGSTPSGSLVGLAAGTKIYCIATTTDTVNAGSITWSAVGGTADPAGGTNNTSGADADGTIASVPTKQAVFTVHTTDVPPIITASYTTGSPAVSKGVSQAIPTAQELFDQLTHAIGFGDTVAGHDAPGMLFDPTTHALTFHLVKKIAAPASITGGLDFADRLKSASGLLGLSPDSGASVSISAKNVVLDVTFGVILSKNLSDISPVSSTPSFLDRFFVKAPASGSPLSVEDASVTATVKLAGRIGFLGITGEGASTADCSGAPSAAFCIGRNDTNKPIIALDLTGGQTITAGSGSIGDAIPIPELLAHITDHASITPNFKLAGGLKVTASVGGTELTHGGVSFSWPISSLSDLTNGTNLDVQTDTSFQDDLQKFWEMAKNDPTALFTVILDALRQLAQSEATTSGDTGSVMDTQLPLVNTSPRQLLQQFTRLQTALDEIASGSGALITCTNQTDAGRGASGAVGGDTLRCKAAVTTGAPTTVHWAVLAGASSLTVTNADDPTTFDTNAAHYVEFTLPSGTSGFANSQNTSGFHIHVAYSDPTNSHTGDLPALSSPPTLQDFVTYLAAKLGLPQNVLTATIIQTPKPGGVSPVPTLKLGLKYDICTAKFDLVGDCSSAGYQVETPQLPINAGLGTVGGLSPSIQTTGTVDLEFNAHAQLDVGFPLDGGISTLPTPEILGSTGASIAVGAGSDPLHPFGAQASLGPLSIALGNLATKGHDGTSNTVLSKFQLGGKVTVGKSGAGANDAFDLATFAGGLHIAFANNGSGSDCGSVDADYSDDATAPDPTLPQDMSGFGCATMTMNVNDTFIGDLGLRWSDFADVPSQNCYDSGVTGSCIAIPSDLASRLEGAVFNIDFLLKALPQLLDQLQSTLSNANGTTKLPVVGDALDAGAGIVDSLNKSLVVPVTNGLAAAIGAVGSPNDISTKVDQFLFDQLASAGQGATGAKAGILLDTNGDNSVTPADVGLKLMCKDSTHSGALYDCTTSTETNALSDGGLTKIQDASIDIHVGQGIGIDPAGDLKACAQSTTTCDTSHQIPFDIGLDGLPLRVTGTLAPSVGWKAHLNFGMDRNGPYLVVNHNDNDVQVGAALHLGTNGACAYDSAGKALLAARTAYGTYKDSTACLDGTLGFLQVRATDTDGSDNSIANTGVQLLAGVKITRSDTSDPDSHLPLTQFANLSAKFLVKAQADANLLIHAGITGTGNSFPSVYGLLHAHWDWGFGNGNSMPSSGDTLGGTTTPTPAVSFDNLNIDIGQLLNNYLNPIFQQIKSVTSPLKPVVDVLQAPIPVVSQLAALVGKPPVTLIDLAEAASGSDLSFVKSLIAFLHFIQNFDVSQNGLLSLDFLNNAGSGGAFHLDSGLLNSVQPASNAGNLVDTNPAHGYKASDITTGINGATATNTVDSRPSTFGVPGLSIPIMKDPGNIFKLLMGSDVTLIEYDFGTLSATAGFSYTFGPFMVGPVPVSIVIGGSITINGSLEIGYDTTGLREVLNGGSADKLLDGLFFDTYRNGKEVPVVQLIGTVFAGAEVDLEIIKAGIEAGLTLTINFYFDDPTPDGKMSFQDIGNKLNNPICLFRVTGSLDAFLKAFVEIDLFFFSDRFEFTILQLHLLDFSAACSPPSPEPATVDNHVLKLNIGPRASLRNINTDEKNEKIVVRPLPDPGAGHTSRPQFGVTIFGAYKEYGNYDSGAGDHVTSVYGDGGDGNDDIEMQPGADSTGSGCTTTNPCVLPFTTPTDLHGGTGNDNLVGGEGNDTIYGDDNSDKLSGNGGQDILSGGGGGGDQLDGGAGTDTLCSGTWNGTDCGTPADKSVVESGGPGNDHLYGSTDADQLNGGPGLDPNAPDPDSAGQTYGQTKPSLLDGNDYIVGYAGQDQINGGPGNDTIFGDEVISNDHGCTQAGADAAPNTSNADLIDAGPGSDQVWGGSGDDQIKGGSGTDGVVATNDNDFLCGNAGNDTIEGDPSDGSATGNDVVMGGPDNDTLTGGPGNDYVNGGTGNDSVSGGSGDDDVLGGTGRDRVSGGTGNDIAVGEAATVSEYDSTSGALSIDHLMTSTQLAAKVTSVDETSSTETPLDCLAAYNPADTTAGNSDCVDGGTGDDALYGGGGRDTITGDDGNDWESGGADADAMFGGLGDDVMYGDAGDDAMQGDSGNDAMYGGDDQDTMHGGLGTDYLEGNGGADTIFGDQDNDHILGGSSTSGAPDQNLGGHGDVISGGAGQDTVVGDNGKITGDGQVVIYDDCSSTGGDDTITGDEGADWLFGGNGTDTISGGDGADYIEGNAGTDTIHGDDNSDRILGGSSSDTSPGGGAAQSYTLACDTGDALYGDAGNDVMLGDNGLIAPDGTTTMSSTIGSPATFGDDTMRGGAGQDQMYGELGNDTMTGDADEDYLLGDLGAITTPGSGPAAWPGGAPNLAVALISPNDGGADVMYGGSADDHLYGGAGDDTVQGGGGDDHLEGNGGADSMYGLSDDLDGSSCSAGVSSYDCAQAAQAAADVAAGASDQDDMIGGSSAVNHDATKLDAGETVMKGNLAQDVMLGDNGTIVRTVDPSDATKWAQDPIVGGAARAVTLTYSDLPDCSTGVCGGDTMEGDGANDRLYGEGGDDTISGDATGHAISGTAGDDYVEGNQGTDTIHGNDGSDDLIGGSAEIASGSGDAAVGRPDAGDTISGDGGADVITGDNAVVSKLGGCPNAGVGDVITNRPGMSDCQRTIRLLDLGTSTAGTFGGDTINGGDGVDVIFGESGSDTVHGDTGDDYVEGNQDSDTLYGDAGQDDIIGGSSHIASGSATTKTAVGQPDTGDTIRGGDDADVILGDNGAVLRIGTTAAGSRANTLEDATKGRGMTQRTIALYDLGDTPTTGTSGGDYVEGNGGNDVILGQSGNDRLKGNDGADYIEGNADTDSIDGNAGDDDLVGGSSTPLSGNQNQSPPVPGDATSGQPDANDRLNGGAGDDLLAGDNAVISRVGATAAFLTTRLSSSSTGDLLTPRFLQLLDLNNGGSYLNPPSAIRYGADQVSGGSGNDVAFGQDGNDAVSGGGGDDYLEGNGGADTIRGDLLLGDAAPLDVGVSVKDVAAPETTVAAFPAAVPAWPADADPSTTADEGAGAAPAGQDDILGGSSVPGFRDTGDSIEGDGAADFVLADNGTIARKLTGAVAGSYGNAVHAERFPTAHVPADAPAVRLHDEAIETKYGVTLNSTRFCTPPTNAVQTATCEVGGAYGNDRVFGDAGDDTLYAQDGNDYLRGGDGNDDMYGETGDDQMFGDGGADAMLGDRGGIVDTYINGPAGGTSTDPNFTTFTVTLNMPPAINYTGFVAGTVDRRVDLLHDVDGSAFVGSGARNPMPLEGATHGGDDAMRGGTGRDSMHGGAGDDRMNGDSGGDTLFGDDGADVMWGGRGCQPSDGEDLVPAGQTCAYPNDATQEGTAGAYANTRDALLTVPGTGATFTLGDGSVDYLFGGHGSATPADLSAESGSDIMDWRPRGSTATPGTTCATGEWPTTRGDGTTVDPCDWFVQTNTDDDPATSANPATDPAIQDNQHHQGIDWMYGGWDRDILQGDVADNGPNPGDRLLDWSGTYNLYTHCNAAYGGFNDVRQLSPSEQSFIQRWAASVGAGQIGTADISTNGTSAYDEVALVYTSDVKYNTGSAYPSTPGHFDSPNSCGL